MIYKMSIEEMVEYAKKRIADGAEIIAAKKGTPVLFEKAPVGFTFNTYVSDGRTEVEKVTIEEGDMIATALNPDESVKIMETVRKINGRLRLRTERNYMALMRIMKEVLILWE